MKKYLNIIPVLLIAISSVLSFIYYLNFSVVCVLIAFALMILLVLYYFASLWIAPIRNGMDIFCEALVIPLILLPVPAEWGFFLTKYPYISPFVFISVPVFIIYLIVFIIKCVNRPKTISE